MSFRTLDPLCYVHPYITKRKDLPSRFIIATDYTQVFGGILVKYLFGVKVVCLAHDTRLYRCDWARSSFGQIGRLVQI